MIMRLNQPQAAPEPQPEPRRDSGPVPAQPPHKETAKDTVISVVIAFTLAFVFRSFVVEAFIIPTGSMAPTLLGAHVRFTSGQSGNSWAVAPWDGSPMEPRAIQGSPTAQLFVHDRLSGERLVTQGSPLSAGDRILVLKYVYALFEPRRFDVIVFKDTVSPSVNIIKRLVGLPGEQVALVDGDVFVRPAPTAADAALGMSSWAAQGWKVQRKPDRVQRAVWQRLYDSSMEPASPATAASGQPFQRPWTGAGWTEAGPGSERGTLEHPGGGPVTLAWDDAAVWMRLPNGEAFSREIDDRYPYNENWRSREQGGTMSRVFPVSDVRLGAGVRPGAAAVVRAVVAARGHEFAAEIDRQRRTARLLMRPQPDAPPATPAPWTTLAEAALADPWAGGGGGQPAVAVEFWHFDQSLELYVGGRRVVAGTYDWSPLERVRHATGRDLDDILAEHAQRMTSALGANVEFDPSRHGNPLVNPQLYRRAKVRWEFDGTAGGGGGAGPVRVSRLTLDRDIHYQPAEYFADPVTRQPLGLNEFPPAIATHPVSTMHVKPDQFFVLGDNSPQSKDSRLFDQPDWWVTNLMKRRGMVKPDGTVERGIVPRDLVLGRAFFVYFPALVRAPGRPPMPDFGRLRVID